MAVVLAIWPPEHEWSKAAWLGYIATARRISERRMILAGYRLADLLRGFWATRHSTETAVQKQKESEFSPVFLGRKNFDCAQLLR